MTFISDSKKSGMSEEKKQLTTEKTRTTVKAFNQPWTRTSETQSELECPYLASRMDSLVLFLPSNED